MEPPSPRLVNRLNSTSHRISKLMLVMKSLDVTMPVRFKSAILVGSGRLDLHSKYILPSLHL